VPSREMFSSIFGQGYKVTGTSFGICYQLLSEALGRAGWSVARRALGNNIRYTLRATWTWTRTVLTT
jgi:hypothetical protein